MFLVICFVGGTAYADDIDDINAMFDTIQNAHACHDIGLLGAQYSDEGMLLIGDYPDPAKGGFVLTKDKVLIAMQRQVWQVEGLESRTITNRRIAVKNDFAFIRMVINDQFKSGRTDSSEQLVIAIKRDSHWKACFAMPVIMSARITITSVEPGSPADKAQLKAGDVIISCNGEDVDPALFSDSPMAVINKRGTSDVNLRIQRSGSEIKVQAPSGLAGAKLEATLVPNGSAVLLPVADPHPVRDILRSEIEILKNGDVSSLQGIVCPSGFFSYRRELGGPTTLVSSENFQQVMGKQLTESRKALDVSTIEIKGLAIIATSNIAIASATISAKERSGTPLRIPTRLEVYVRNGQQWFLVANLVERFHLSGAGGSSITQSLEETRRAQQGSQGTMVGIGVKLSKQSDGFYIEQVLSGQPAERSGLNDGEVILSIDGHPAKEMSMDEGVKAITGDEGTQVALEIKDSSGGIRNVKITREKMILPGIIAKMLDERTGYLQITSFNLQTPSAVRQALTTTLSSQNAGIILDLRGNSGGVYSEVLKVAEMLVDGDPPKLLWIVRQTGKEPVQVQVKSHALTTLPCVILIDEKTSGAAELLAEALRQNAHAKLVGSRTAGGAILKERIPNPDGSSNVVQVGDFLFPQTGKTGLEGVIPDVTAPEDATSEQVLQLGQKTLASFRKSE